MIEPYYQKLGYANFYQKKLTMEWSIELWICKDEDIDTMEVYLESSYELESKEDLESKT